MRKGAVGERQCLEAQVMDLADDVAYSVHDVEDGTVAGRVDLTTLDRPAVWQTVRDWYRPDATDDRLDEVLVGLQSVGSWPPAPYDGTRRSLAALKNLTSDLIGRFCGAVQQATFAAGDGPFVRYRADLVVPETTALEMALLKGVAAHYVMRAEDRVAAMERQREVIAELVEALVRRPDTLDRQFADDWAAAPDDAGRLRAVIDQVASLDRRERAHPPRRAARWLTDPLVWLPFEPDRARRPADGAALRDGRPHREVPASVGEVAFYVTPYQVGAGGRPTCCRGWRGLEVVQTLTAGVENIQPQVPEGSDPVQRSRHPRHLDGRAGADPDPVVAARRARVRARPGASGVGAAMAPSARRPHVLLVGYGAIGQAIERRLLPFEVDVRRVARTARAGVHAIDELPDLLPECRRRGADRAAHRPDPRARRRRLPGPDEGRRAPGQRRPRCGGRHRRPRSPSSASGRITAALDVVDPEPLPADHALWSAPGLLITPHVGGPSSAMWPRAHRLVRDQLHRYAAGEPLSNVMSGHY